MQYKPKTHIVTPRAHVNYAAIMGDLIRSLAEEQGVSEAEYRAMIRTPEGEEVFRFVCAWYGVPLFECRYRERNCPALESMRKNLLRLKTVRRWGHGENTTQEEKAPRGTAHKVPAGVLSAGYTGLPVGCHK